MTTADIIIREENDADIASIANITVAAFRDLAISQHTEQFIIDALRAAGALSLSLVAELDGHIVGHVAFSPLTFSDGSCDWYGLGPVSVLPEFQRKGIGKALIQTGLATLKQRQAKGCCLVGHPGYYRQFGFENVAGLTLEGVPPEVLFALSFDGPVPQGEVFFHPGFHASGH